MSVFCIYLCKNTFYFYELRLVNFDLYLCFCNYKFIFNFVNSFFTQKYIIMHSRIFQFIESKQMTQSDFAGRTGISPSALTQLKNNEGNLSIDNVIKIKNAFPNISLDWLISGVGQMIEQIDNSPKGSLFPEFDELPSQSPSAIPETVKINERQNASPGSTTPMPDIQTVEKTIEKVVEKFVERKISKVIVFYDDGKFEELSKE